MAAAKSILLKCMNVLAFAWTVVVNGLAGGTTFLGGKLTAEISAMIAAAGVLVGVVYHILDMRNKARIRKTDLIVRITPWFNLSPKELAEIANTVMER